MKRRICVRSMVLGAVIMLIGLAVGAIVSPPLIAQHNGVFEEIQCSRLLVVDKAGKVTIALSTFEDGSVINVYDKMGKTAITLGANENGRAIGVNGRAGKEAIVLGAFEDTNAIVVNGRAGKEAIVLGGTEEYPNAIAVVDRAGNTRWITP